jgi:hypothetical protein
MCFYTSANRPISKKISVSSFEIHDGRQYSFQKLTQFSLGNNVLDAPISNIDGFLSRDTVFLHLSIQAYLEQSEFFSPLKTLMGRQYFFQ